MLTCSGLSVMGAVCSPSKNNTKHCCSPTNKKRNYESGSVFCVIRRRFWKEGERINVSATHRVFAPINLCICIKRPSFVFLILYHDYCAISTFLCLLPKNIIERLTNVFITCYTTVGMIKRKRGVIMNNKSISLPTSLKSYRRKKYVFHIVLCLLAVSALVATHVFLPQQNSLVIVLLILLYITGFFAAIRLLRILIDKCFCGKIVSLECKTYQTKPPHPAPLGLATQTDVIIYVETTTQKIHWHTLASIGGPPKDGSKYTVYWGLSRALLGTKGINNNDSTSQSISYYEDFYTSGKPVYKFYGFPHLYVEDQATQEKTCIICGARNHLCDTTCWSCQKPLIENSHLDT